MQYIIGIDIGTGSTKAVAVSLLHEPLASASSSYPTYHQKTGYSEQNPDLIWSAFVHCITDVIEKLEDKPIAIALSSAMHSVIPVDENGIPLEKMTTWADSRSASIAKNIKESQNGKQIYLATGTPIYAMSPLSKIIWIKENQPEIFAKTHKFISIKEYIWYKLFNEFKVDHSIASGTGMLNLETLEWNAPSLALAGISKERLSEPVQTGYIQTNITTDQLPSLPVNTPFVIGASDGCMANLGSLAITPGVAAVTIGTSGAVRVANHKPVFNFGAMTFSYVLDDKTFICGGPVNNGGIALQWYMKTFLNKDILTETDYSNLFKEVDSVNAGSQGLIFMPYLAGERAPLWDSQTCGTFFGIRLHHTKAHFARAVLEGICFALYEVLMAVETNSSGINQINVSGGFVNSQTWVQILADITGKKILLIQTEDASAVGAAYMAIKALGNEKQYPSLSDVEKEVIVEPNQKNHEVYSKNFLIFKQLYGNLKDSMHQLHNLNN